MPALTSQTKNAYYTVSFNVQVQRDDSEAEETLNVFLRVWASSAKAAAEEIGRRLQRVGP